MHILLVEDDLDLGASLVRALQQDGFTVQWLRRAHDAPLQLDDPGCSAVLLDLGLPDGSGMELLRRWRRAQAAAPVLVITARSALQDRLGGLDAGADDYLVKPFDIPELLARLRAVLRRTAAQSGEQWQFGALSVWPRKCQAQLGGQPLELTPREFQLLLALAQGGGDVVPKRTLAQRLEPLGDPM
ncbi:response regulator transcription factor, partial [Acidovorax sp.]|uniref:response regulator transcription factor n=1 Tax=Acidovorax sp. TaxID=1872122 RepID=UPI0025B9C4C8